MHLRAMKTELFEAATPNARRTWILAIPVLVLVFFVVGQLLVLLPTKWLDLTSRETIETYPSILYLIIGVFSMVAVIFGAWLHFFERRSWASVGLGLGKDTRRNYVLGFGLGLLMAASVVYAVRLFGGYVVESEVGLQFYDLAPILILMFGFMLQSGVEELIFRGWMLGRIAARYGLWAGVIGNSVLFTLIHIDTEALAALGLSGILLFTAMTMLFSVFLSLLVIKEKSIWGAAAWHAAWNWMFITWFGLPTTGIELNLVPLVSDLMPAPEAAVWLTGGTDGPEGSILALVVLALGCLWLVRSLRRNRSLEHQ
jgi:membrane protease YdiL (CAAX protease family)